MPTRKTHAAAPVQPAQAEERQVRPPKISKLAALVALLRRPEGARIDEMMTATGWQAHSVRGAMSGALKKAQNLAIVSEKIDAGRVYRILPETAG